MSSYRRHYLPSISRSDVKGGVRLIQPYSVTDYFLIFRVQNLLTSASRTTLIYPKFLSLIEWGFGGVLPFNDRTVGGSNPL